MAEHFEYYFEGQLPSRENEQSMERYTGKPLVADVIGEANATIGAIEQFQDLPERNQRLLLDMAGYIIDAANMMFSGGHSDRWKQNYWGLYIVGSRARNEAGPDSDLDLLSVGTFYSDQCFGGSARPGESKGIFEGFDLDVPEELPDEYNVGDVDRKFLVRATPTTPDTLAFDLSVVDLTFIRGVTLDIFKEKMDVDESGAPLSRIPLVEVTVAGDQFA